jgi:hypothetical protein
MEANNSPVGIKIAGCSRACPADSQSQCPFSLEPPVTASEIREQLGIWSYTNKSPVIG